MWISFFALPFLNLLLDAALMTLLYSYIYIYIYMAFYVILSVLLALLSRRTQIYCLKTKKEERILHHKCKRTWFFDPLSSPVWSAIDPLFFIYIDHTTLDFFIFIFRVVDIFSSFCIRVHNFCIRTSIDVYFYSFTGKCSGGIYVHGYAYHLDFIFFFFFFKRIHPSAPWTADFEKEHSYACDRKTKKKKQWTTALLYVRTDLYLSFDLKYLFIRLILQKLLWAAI